MAILDMAGFINQVQQGYPVQILSCISIQTDNTVIIAGQPVKLNGTSYELGIYHSAKDILDSYSLRASLNSGQVVSQNGVVSISVTPVDIQV